MNRAAPTLEAYNRWAPLYPSVAHNPLMRAEQRSMVEHWPNVAGRRALDLACGSGRYARLLTETHAAEVIAVDFCAPMLARASAVSRVRADMMSLPFVNGAFDVVISGLALGHSMNVQRWMAEVARVLRQGGTLLYSDFHPAAARAGLPRSFKDEHGRTWTVPHRRHELASQMEAAAAAGLTLETVDEIRVGFEFQERFPKSEEFYRQWHGLPLVLVVRARK
jgi:malonyl-CoA O-methyltransferase